MTKNPKFSQSNNVSNLSEKKDDNLNYYFLAGGLTAATFLYYYYYSKPGDKVDNKPQTTDTVSREIKTPTATVVSKPQIKPHKQVSDDRLI